MKPNSRNEVRSALSACTGGLATTGLFSLVINLLMLASPLYMMQVYDRVLTSHSQDTLIALSVLVIGLLVVMGILELIRSRILVRVGSRIERRLDGRVFESLVSRSIRGTESNDDQPLRDLRSLREFLSGPGPFAFFDSPWVPVYIGVIYLLHPVLALVAAAGALFLFSVALLNNAWTRRPLGQAGQRFTEGDVMAGAGQRNAEVLRAMGMLGGLRRRWLMRQRDGLQHQARASDRAGLLTATSKTGRLILQAAILGFGAALVIEEAITPGAMIAASIILGRALAPVEQAIGQWRSFIGARTAYARLGGLLDEHPQAERRMSLPRAKSFLEVEKVHAGPPESRRPVVSALNFSLLAGEALAVIGPSASGKSSLARLLVGVWQPQRGALRLDGVALDQWDPRELGPQIGYLPQDVELFEGSVAENIARLDEDADPEAIVTAAKLAGCHSMILDLPDGYNTAIGENGSKLSGGQRQRIGLARALFGDPFLVVLDEPNANLDADGDCALGDAIREMKRRGLIVVVMAHRPSAIEAADKLLVLRGGRQQAFGPKDEVLAATTQPLPASTNGNVATLPRRKQS
ncbi:type I secretion system permease/ATPase [Pelagibius sp. Alg239-R121]|uniref:type I secretion system permease/ATPase n=1 Tax=Pelagibius sp. Alg239-R121 TaxID=2993448 RepID=UPI0024A6D626|nr:type I secretion system permease/ATPase [Pelagibius sp. Alg239-R121]